MVRNTPIRIAIIGGETLFREALVGSLQLQPVGIDPAQKTGAAVIARAELPASSAAYWC
jgi:hypothetical protein